MIAQRKTRSDSATAAINAAKNVAMGDLAPPEHVIICSEAMPYFRDIVRARTRDEWDDLQLTVAAQLAECFLEQVEVKGELLLEGRVLTNERGTRVANPLVGIMEQLARREMALMRTLQMGGRVPGTAGDKRKKQAGRQLERGARQAADEAAEEANGLLA